MEVRKRRASGAAGVRFAARLLGTDATGTWLIVDAGTPHVHDGGWVAYVAPNPVLCVVPDAQSWVASTSAISSAPSPPGPARDGWPGSTPDRAGS